MEPKTLYKFRFLPPMGEYTTSYWQQERLLGLSLGECASPESEGRLLRRCGASRVAECPPEEPTPAMEQLEHELGEYYAGTRTVFTLPITLYGTEFQKKIWTALLAVPYGTVTTYSALADAAGVQGDRACGSAVGSNPIALVVPCHRVLPRGGGLGSYSTGRGPATKQALLELEQKGNQGGVKGWK